MKRAAMTLTVLFVILTAGIIAVAAYAYSPNSALGFLVKDSSMEPASDTQEESSSPESSSSQPEEPDQEITFNRPENMRAVTLTPGTDFLIPGEDVTEEKLKGDVDTALASAQNLTMNTVVVDLTYDGHLIYASQQAPYLFTEFDVLDYLMQQAHSSGLYVYLQMDIGLQVTGTQLERATALTPELISFQSGLATELAGKYGADGILLTGYANEENAYSFAAYMKNNPGSGFEIFMRSTTENLVNSVASAIQSVSPSTQVGLMVDEVWENDSRIQTGSDTTAAYTMYTDGHADAIALLENGVADFLFLRADVPMGDADAPFETVAAWWANLAQNQDVPLYIMHAVTLAAQQAQGWTDGDEILNQVLVDESLEGCQGSGFDSLSAMVEDTNGCVTSLLTYFDSSINVEHVVHNLAVTSPEQTTFTTYEPKVTFRGASDPEEPVYLDGEQLEQDENGYFVAERALSPGINTFVIKHKDQEETYQITRNVQVIQSVNPTGTLTVDGGMEIELEAVAMDGASVTATLNGKTVSLRQTDQQTDSTDKTSSYHIFVGTIIMPSATSSKQNLGNITFYGTWNGASSSKTGANVRINALPVPPAPEDPSSGSSGDSSSSSGDSSSGSSGSSDGGGSSVTGPVYTENLIQVSVSEGTTLDPNKLDDDVFRGDLYPMPAGTIDVIVGEPLHYGNQTYYKTLSGQRVYADEVQRISGSIGGNVISSMTVTSDSRYTYVSFDTAQKVAFVAKYTGSAFTIDFKYTDQVPPSLALTQNSLFSGASWSGTKLTLNLLKANGFLGYKSYYDGNGNLVFRFNNPTNGLSGAYIFVERGHPQNAGDQGAVGFVPGLNELQLNQAVVSNLVEILRSRGTNVATPSDSAFANMHWSYRVAEAEAYGPQLYISVHHNSYGSSSVKGTETYFVRPFAQNYASYVASNVSSAIGTSNRGAKASKFYVTRSHNYATILCECGFVSNREEYNKLIESSTQRAIAQGIADAMDQFLRSTYSYTRTGTQTSSIS